MHDAKTLMFFNDFTSQQRSPWKAPTRKQIEKTFPFLAASLAIFTTSTDFFCVNTFCIASIRAVFSAFLTLVNDSVFVPINEVLTLETNESTTPAATFLLIRVDLNSFKIGSKSLAVRILLPVMLRMASEIRPKKFGREGATPLASEGKAKRLLQG